MILPDRFGVLGATFGSRLPSGMRPKVGRLIIKLATKNSTITTREINRLISSDQ